MFPPRRSSSFSHSASGASHSVSAIFWQGLWFNGWVNPFRVVFHWEKEAEKGVTYLEKIRDASCCVTVSTAVIIQSLKQKLDWSLQIQIFLFDMLHSCMPRRITAAFISSQVFILHRSSEKWNLLYNHELFLHNGNKFDKKCWLAELEGFVFFF